MYLKVPSNKPECLRGVFVLTLRALRKARIQLQELYIRTQCTDRLSRCSKSHLCGLPLEQLVLAPKQVATLSDLRRINVSLHLVTNHEHNNKLARQFASTLLRLLQLSDVFISFDTTSKSEVAAAFKRFAKYAYLPKLHTLSLWGMHIAIPDLIAFLSKHHASLRNIVLTVLRLEPPSDINSLLCLLRDDLIDLESLVMYQTHTQDIGTGGASPLIFPGVAYPWPPRLLGSPDFNVLEIHDDLGGDGWIEVKQHDDVLKVYPDENNVVERLNKAIECVKVGGRPYW